VQSRSQRASPRVIWCRTDCVMSASDVQIAKYELPVNRGVKSYELHLVIELYGMSSRAGRWTGTVCGRARRNCLTDSFRAPVLC